MERLAVALSERYRIESELGNREFRTAKLVADHLRALGLEVETEVAHTGVVGVLRGARPGPVACSARTWRARDDGDGVALPAGAPIEQSSSRLSQWRVTSSSF